MTPEQKRIRALEATVLDLVVALEEARIGFGSRFSAEIRRKIEEDRAAFKFTTPKKATTPAAPVEEEAPA